MVATDGSAGAARAVLWAAREAALRRQLHIVCAVDLDLAERLSTETARRVREAARSLVAEAAVAASGRAPDLWSPRRSAGNPWRTACYGPHRQCHMPGTRRDDRRRLAGLSGFSALLLGSVALTLAGQARCPVGVVRGTERPSSGVTVVGVRDERDLETVRFAEETARRRKASFRLLSTWTYIQYILTGCDVLPARRDPVTALAATGTAPSLRR
ncbi:universal stress protein [Streptomyces sp. NPDC088124]|uniref:universal stress protein n=1 Tax=Streptomyces sp. NPDC088124 TaxID=3154654 RepID=UPI00343B5300